MNKSDFMISLAMKAGKIVTGTELIINKVRSHDAYLVIVANDASDNTKKLFSDKCSYNNVKYVLYSNVDHLSNIIGKNNRVAIAITDKKLAGEIYSKINEK